MYEKALITIIFMYAASFSMLGVQYVIGDVFGITFTNFDGDEIKSQVLSFININTLNTGQTNIISQNQTEVETDPIGVAAGIAWELILLLTGTYIFNLLYLFGIPPIIIVGLVAIYVFLVGRMMIAYIRGI